MAYEFVPKKTLQHMLDDLNEIVRHVGESIELMGGDLPEVEIQVDTAKNRYLPKLLKWSQTTVIEVRQAARAFERSQQLKAEERAGKTAAKKK